MLAPLEGMRAVAALMVFGGHVLWFSQARGSDLSQLGIVVAQDGVGLFFAISGFLLYRPFLAMRARRVPVGPGLPSYLLRRAVRIYPAYWVALTLLALWPGMSGVFSDRWWSAYGLLQLYTYPQLGLDGSWTLCVEVSFYLALPAIAWLLYRRGLGSGRRHELRWEIAVLAALAGLSLAARAVLLSEQSTPYLGMTLLGTFSLFCAGMLCAVVYTAGPRLGRARSLLSSPRLAALVVPLALAVLWWTAGVDYAERTPFDVVCEMLAYGAFAAALLGMALFGPRLVRGGFASRPLVFLGTISYGIYLWHAEVLEHLAGSGVVTGSFAPVPVLAVLAFGISVAAGACSWYLVEKPLMKRAGSVKARADRMGWRRWIRRPRPLGGPGVARAAEIE